MTSGSPQASTMAWRAAMLASFAAVAAYLLHRNLGLSPAIFADEWYYSKMSRLLPLSESTLPSYLYLWIFGASKACGQGFLDCVRVGNVLLFVGAAPFIYLVARQVTGKGMAFAVTLMCMLAPGNVYTAYFMPEATYFFSFSLLSWIVLTHTEWGAVRMALVAGTVLGLMSLVKVHALFLLPALVLYLLYLQWSSGGAWLGSGLLAIVLATLAALGVKLGVGYLLAGATALNLFGSFYSQAIGARPPLAELLSPAFINGRGHLMALAVLLGLPLAMIACSVLSPGPRERARSPRQLLQLYALLMLAVTVGMTVAFTATVAHFGAIEGVRLHLRYYNFLFPLLLIVAAATPDHDGQPASTRLRWAIALALGVLLVAGMFKLPLYSLNAIDGPELSSLGLERAKGRVVVAINLVVLVLWARGNALARPLFLFLALPLVLLFGGRGTSDYLSQLTVPWAEERAGKLANRYVPKEEHKYITVVASDIQALLRVQFHIDDKDVALVQLPKGAAIETYNLPAHNKWLVVVGPYTLPAGTKTVEANSEFALARVNQDVRRIGISRLSGPLGEGPLAGAEGLSPAEPWGRWSNARRVVLHFKQPLPRRLSVILKARAFGPNEALQFRLRAGENEVGFRVGQVEQDIGLRIETDGRQRSLTIEVPKPASPAELGLSGDTRKLGIGLAAIEIGSGDKAVPTEATGTSSPVWIPAKGAACAGTTC